jgi:hypothetical protein
MTKQAKETQNAGAGRPSPRPRQERISEMYEVIDLARSQIRFASDPLVTEVERQRLCRAAAALLDHVIGQRDDDGRGFISLGEAARRAVERISRHDR